MRRRLWLVLAALTLVLLLPAAVAADTGPGLNLRTESETLCNDNLCAQAFLDVNHSDGSAANACLTIIYTNAELGGAEYDRETGCVDPLGGPSLSKGLIVGIPATSFTLTADLGGSRTVTVSASYVLTSPIDRSTLVDVIPDQPEAGCTTTETWKTRHATVEGTLNIGATAFDAAGDTWEFAVRSKVRC